MPNGGSDCCGTCWFNRSNGGRRGSANFSRGIPSYCEIRCLDIPDPFYTYCANHPHHRSNRDPIPIGPVYVGDSFGVREFWKPSPDTVFERRYVSICWISLGHRRNTEMAISSSHRLRTLKRLSS